MAILLSLETATPVCSVALHSSGKLLASSHLLIEQQASTRLTVMIDELLKRCNITPRQLGGVAVSCGPGSYTGLRIGVATAKGLCYPLGIPLIAVNTLEALSRRSLFHASEATLLCPMIDARRMEVYCQLVDRSGNILEPVQAKVIEKDSFASWLEHHPVLFFGSGAEKCRSVIQSQNARFLDGVAPSAVEIGELASPKFEKEIFEDVFAFEPLYLKDFLIKKPISTS